MEETHQNFSYANADPETTLMQPRFDESEAQTARPVVPLSRSTSLPRRTLPVALVLVSALIGGLVSVVAYRLYQRPAQTQTQTRVTEQTPTTQGSQTPPPVLTAAAPAPAEAAPRVERKEIASVDATKKTEEASAKDEPAVVARDETKKVAADEKRAEHRAEQDARATRDSAPRARRVEVITSPDAMRGGRDRRRDDETTDQIQPDPRDARHARRARGRNIDRIRDIFGAPPPG
jgi:hypothetical protein